MDFLQETATAAYREANRRDEIKQAYAVIAVLVDRLGGQIEITIEELNQAQEGDWTLTTGLDAASYAMRFRLTKRDASADNGAPLAPSFQLPLTFHNEPHPTRPGAVMPVPDQPLPADPVAAYFALRATELRPAPPRNGDNG